MNNHHKLLKLVCNLFFIMPLAYADDGEKSMGVPDSESGFVNSPTTTTPITTPPRTTPPRTEKKPKQTKKRPSPVYTPAQPNSVLTYWVDLTKPNGEKLKITDPAHYRFKSGDHVVINYTTTIDGQMQISNLGSTGVMQIIDSQDITARQVRSTNTFAFDNHPGKERLELAFSPTVPNIPSPSCDSSGKKDLEKVDLPCGNDGNKDLNPVNSTDDSTVIAPTRVYVDLIHN